MDAEIKSRFTNAGLEVVARYTGVDGPSVEEAFHRVVHIDATPVQRMQKRGPDAAHQVDDAWKACAHQGGVVADDGAFLAAGSMSYGWVHVRLTPATDISALADQGGELLFIARSLSGHRVCAASTEGSEYWILEMDFPAQE
ncbi:hypothetical protein [Streptomyces sp. GbtcB6]|uniref:hypothetical protein n=1 Tax=Streptomyces sp. GbtcB6 TaxID=2824751 RepID=UPI001C2FA591|nr:hypothetical protein [Streptomyces sp. GbtcB6]